jgi:hypothetical protein
MTSLSTPGKVIVDPNADTIIVLRDQGAYVAVWDDAAEFPRPPFVLPGTVSNDLTADDSETVVKEERDCGSDEFEGKNPESEAQAENETRFHVSSRHLKLASTYFHKNLSDRWDQHERDEKGRVLLSEVGWSKGAFARLMCVIHGRTRAVPRTLALKDLAETAHMVNYYDCAEVVEVYSVVWIQHLKDTGYTPMSYGMDLVLWLCVAWVFGEEHVFNELTKVAMFQCRSGMQIMGLPIPEIVTSKLTSEWGPNTLAK